MELFTLGFDLGKTTFQVVGMNQRGEGGVAEAIFSSAAVALVALVGLDVGLHILRRDQRCSCKACPRKCDPPHASMPISSTFRFAVTPLITHLHCRVGG